MEIWRDVVGYEGIYKVSSIGRVKSLERLVKCGHPGSNPRRKKEKVLNINYHTDGYPQTQLNVDGKFRTIKIHRLVAEAFLPNPKCFLIVNHKDGNKANNSADNLEWCTSSENVRHALNTGLLVHKTGENHHNSKLNQNQAQQIRGVLPQRKVAKIFGVSQNVVTKIQLERSYIK